MLRVSIAVFSSLMPRALAISCLPTVNLLTGGRSVVHFVNQYDDADRRTKEAYARENEISEAEVENRYGGSGDLFCDGYKSQGSVTVKNDLVLISAHGLGLKSGCKPPGVAATKCKFFLKIDNKPVSYDVAGEMAAGFKCPRDEGKPLENDNDWSILKLKKPVSAKIKPYKVELVKKSSDQPLRDVVFVAKSTDFNPTGAKTYLDRARHYGNCKVININGTPPHTIQSNCDVDEGGSGGGLFRPGPEPVLVGIMEDKNVGCVDGTGTNGSGPSKDRCWSSLLAPINQTMIDELNKAAAKK